MSRADIEAGRAIVRLVVEGRQETHVMLTQVNKDLQEIKKSAESISFAPGDIIPAAVPASFASTAGMMSLVARRTVTARREITGLRDAVLALRGNLNPSLVAPLAARPASQAPPPLQPRTVAFSSRGRPGFANMPRTIITQEGVFQRPGFLRQFLTGGRVSAREWNRFARGLMEGRSAEEMGGRQMLRRALPTEKDLRSIRSVYTPTGYANRAGMDGLWGNKNFMSFLRQRFGTAGTPSPGTPSPGTTSPGSHAAPARPSPPAAAVSAPVAAARAAMSTAGAAASAVSTPIGKAIGLTDRMSKSLGDLGSGLTNTGIKLTIAGAAISAAATPFLLLTTTFTKSAAAVRDYAKEHKVSLGEAIKKTGSGLTEDQVKLGAALADSWGKLKSVAKETWESVAASVGTAIAPQLKEQVFQVQGFLAGVKEAGKAIGGWIEKNSGLAGTLFKVGGAMAVLGIAVAGLGVALTVGASLLGTLGTVAALVINPFTLIAGALAGAGYAWVKYTDTGKAALASFLQTVQPFVDAVSDTFKGVSDAIVAGDLGLAMTIAVAGIKVILAEGLESMRGILGDSLTDIGQQILSGDFTAAWESAITFMASLWDTFASGIVSAFVEASNAAIDAWQKAVSAVSQTILEMSAAGGTAGAIASMLLGVDMSEEQAKSDKAGVQLATANRARAKRLEEEAKKKEAAGDNDAAAKLREQAREARKTADRAMIGSDALGDAKTDVAEASKQSAEAIKKRIAAIRGAQGGGAVNDDGTFDLTKRQKESSAVEQYRKDLEALKQKAKGQADEQRAKGLPELDLGTRKIKSESFVTASAAAAIASGYGMGGKANDPAERAAKAAEENVKQNKAAEKRQIERDAKIIATHEKFFASLSH